MCVHYLSIYVSIYLECRMINFLIAINQDLNLHWNFIVHCKQSLCDLSVSNVLILHFKVKRHPCPHNQPNLLLFCVCMFCLFSSVSHSVYILTKIANTSLNTFVPCCILFWKLHFFYFENESVFFFMLTFMWLSTLLWKASSVNIYKHTVCIIVFFCYCVIEITDNLNDKQKGQKIICH